MRGWRTAIIGIIAGLVLAAPANAFDHRSRVNEVLLSSGMSTTAQYVELVDAATEPFPNVPYQLRVYDGACTEVPGSPEAITMSSGFGFASPIMVATANAGTMLGFTPDQLLTIGLPVSAGEACFWRSGGLSVIHCTKWGTVGAAAPVTTTTGPAPPDGQSLQRQCDESAALAVPTPKAANANVASACGGGGSGSGGGGGGGADTTKPKVRVLALAGAQKLSRVLAHGIAGRLRVDEPSQATIELMRGRSVVGRATIRFTAAATKRFDVRLKPAAASAVGKLSNVTLTLRIGVRDRAGNVTKTSRTVKLTA